jgi:hypothetical protein
MVEVMQTKQQTMMLVQELRNAPKKARIFDDDVYSCYLSIL